MENDEEKIVENVEKEQEESVVETEKVVENNEQEQVETIVHEQTSTEETNSENVEVEAEVVEETEKKKLNGYALASLICSIVGLIIFGMPLGLAAIVTGVNGIREFDKEKQNHKWMAIVGLVIGIIDVIFVSQYSIMIYNQAIQRYNSYLY